MKTIPLDELLQQITPLPWKALTPAVPSAEPGAFEINFAAAGFVNHIVVYGDGKSNHVADARYLAHAANVLPELVTALATLTGLIERGRFVLPEGDFNEEPRFLLAFQAARSALTQATQVPVH